MILFLNFFEFSFSANYFLLALLLVSSALISGSEVALFSLTKKQIDQNIDISSIKIVKSLLEKPKKLLATILITNNLINIAIVILFSNIGNDLFQNISSPVIKFIFEIIFATFLILFFGEILPKIYASRNNVKFSRMIAGILKFLDFIFSPVSIPMQFFSSFINSKLKFKTSTININEISHALEITETEVSDNEEKDFLRGIVTFGNNNASDIMQSKNEIYSISIDSSFVDVIDKISKSKYSRIPVFKQNIESIVGVLHVKDLLPYIEMDNFNWKKKLREPFFVTEDKKLDELILEFQEKRIHLAVVLDNEGKTCGVVSLEDVIEEIVGDITDEFDDEDISYSKIDNNKYIFEGKTSIRDIVRITGIDYRVFDSFMGEAETIAGFVLEISNKFPKINSKISYKNLVFQIESIGNKRISKIKIIIN